MLFLLRLSSLLKIFIAFRLIILFPYLLGKEQLLLFITMTKEFISILDITDYFHDKLTLSILEIAFI